MKPRVTCGTIWVPPGTIRTVSIDRFSIRCPKDLELQGPSGSSVTYNTLTTGANWAGPIKHFRMVVDKGAPENLVSFCGDGIKKISPTEFEVYQQDFVPTSNLRVLFLSPYRADTPSLPEAFNAPGQSSLLDEALLRLQRSRRAFSCSELSHFRNSIFKSAGYCFKTPAAIREFGNAGCAYENAGDIPLSQKQRRAVQEFAAAERFLGCR